MQKDDKKKFVSAKNVRNKCKLVGCSKTQENENESLNTNPPTTHILRKASKEKLQRKLYYSGKTHFRKHFFLTW